MMVKVVVPGLKQQQNNFEICSMSLQISQKKVDTLKKQAQKQAIPLL